MSAPPLSSHSSAPRGIVTSLRGRGWQGVDSFPGLEYTGFCLNSHRVQRAAVVGTTVREMGSFLQPSRLYKSYRKYRTEASPAE